MSLRLPLIATASLLLLTLPRPAPAQAPTPAPPECVISLDVSNADFQTVAGLLGRETHAEFVVRDGPRPYNPVTVRLVDAPLSVALRVIAESAGAEVSRDAGGVTTFSLLGVPDAAPAILSPKPQAQMSINPADLKWYHISL